MNIVYTCFPFPTSISLSTIKLVTKDFFLRPYLFSATRQKFSRKRDLALQAVASFSFPPIDVDCLASEFGIDGVTFSSISDSCVIKMALENGSVANVMLPSGLITSLKVPMWHGGTMELLHTRVSEGENGGAVIQGGISLAFNCQNDRGSWCPNIWALHQVKGTPQESIQVVLISRNSEGNVENTDDDLKRTTRNIEEWEGEEKDNYKHLTDEMSRIYTSAPRKFTVIDRGRRNSVVMRRDGFNELYMFSPGSRHKWYSKYSYICLGQAALLQPISLDSQSEWRGGQHIHNPNF
ncbi:unnamed protein product [Fraxinus pennsylvanica]|uniref:NDH-dependent cyclic electron flow 5 n=1 Tax=Fraxinus pennsylvanica TaxID=56036 RepID=A0AAD2A078_9LAMI|nr:unnamed protein product [Fraxinus pennsylvanica]